MKSQNLWDFALNNKTKNKTEKQKNILFLNIAHELQTPLNIIQGLSSKMIKEEKLITDFPGWQIGYGAFTYSMSSKNKLIEYVKSQEAHHKHISFKEEYVSLLEEHGIEYDEKYLYTIGLNKK